MMHRHILSSLTITLVGALLLTVQSFGQQKEVPLGTKLPSMDRTLTGTEDVRLQDVAGEKGTVLVFWSNECPWVDKYEERLIESAGRFELEGYGFALINANDPVAFPEESVEAMRERAQQRGYNVPYLQDEGSELARALGAERTPHVFIFDAASELVYSGTIDDSPGDPGNVQENYLEDVLGAVAEGEAAPLSRTTAFGCKIKYQD